MKVQTAWKIKNFFRGAKKDTIPKWESWFRRLVKISFVLNVLPIEFNRSTGLYKAPKTRVKRYTWYLVLVIYTVDFMCLLISTRSVDIQKDGAYEYVNFYMHCFVRFSGVVTTWGLTLKLHECICGINIMISNCRFWKRKQNEFDEDFSGPIVRSIGATTKYAVIYCLYVASFVAPLACLESRNSRRYWLTQLLLGPVYDTNPGIIASVIMDLYLSLMVNVSGVFILLLVAVYGSLVSFWATTLTSRFRKEPAKWKSGFKTYRSIQTLLKILEPTFCKFLAPRIVYLAFWNLVLCVAGFITCFRTFPMPVLIDYLCCIVVLLLLSKQLVGTGAHVYEKGEDFKDTARYFLSPLYIIGKSNRNSRLLMRKQLAACTSLKLYVSDHFYMHRSTLMHYMRNVFERSIDIILTIFGIA